MRGVRAGLSLLQDLLLSPQRAKSLPVLDAGPEPGPDLQGLTSQDPSQGDEVKGSLTPPPSPSLSVLALLCGPESTTHTDTHTHAPRAREALLLARL